MEINNSEIEEPIFPTEKKVGSFFNKDEWDVMGDYEKMSYRNIYHNYYMMKSLGLNPERPKFMSLFSKKSTKRKTSLNIENSVKSPGPPSKKQQRSKAKSETITRQSKAKSETITQQSENKSESITQQSKAKSETITSGGESTCAIVEIFSPSEKYRSIRIHNIFNAVYQELVQCSNMIKYRYFNQKLLRKQRDKDNDCNISGPLQLPKKGFYRSIQTQTASEGQPLESTALVFINRATTKILAQPLPESAPLTEQQEKIRKKIGKLKMKKCKTIQTQTAEENASIEESELVFFPVRKHKKNKTAQPSEEREEDKPDSTLPTTNDKDCAGPSGVSEDSSKEREKDKPDSTLLITNDKDIAGPSGVSEATVVVSNKEDIGIQTTTSIQIEEDIFGFSNISDQENEDCSNERKEEKLTLPNTQQSNKKESVDVPESEATVVVSNKEDIGIQTTTSIQIEEDIFGFSNISDQENEDCSNERKEEKLTLPNTQQSNKKESVDVPESVSERRYPRRNIPLLNYREADLLDNDEYLFCDMCDREYEGDCPEHGPHIIFDDNYVPVTGEEGRAEKTSPALVHVANSMIPGAGSGVWTTVGLPGHARLGPYQGKKSAQPDPLGYSWTIMKNGKVDYYLAADSTATSNWMRYVNCARHESEQNLMAFQYKGQLYYRTVKPVPPKVELFVWYGKEYAEKLGISMESFRSRDTSHLKNVVFPCGKCSTTYSSPLYLENHRKTCRGDRRRSTKVLVDPGSLPSDMQTLASVRDGKKVYSCPVCQYETGHSGTMRRHLDVHVDRQYVCDMCSKTFSTCDSLRGHKIRYHTQSKLHKCTQCDYSSVQISNVNDHMRTHTGEKPFGCPHCSYRASVGASLETHIRAVHMKLRPYSCPHCHYKSAQSSDLADHVRAVHMKLKPHSCPHCDYKSAQSSHLADHVRAVHMKLKPHSCPHCNYKCAHSSGLSKHVRRVHAQNKL